MFLKLSQFSQILRKLSKFSRASRASNFTTVLFLKSISSDSNSREAQQQKSKAVYYELPVKRLAFSVACMFVRQLKVSWCRFWMQGLSWTPYLTKNFGALCTHASRFAFHLMTIMKVIFHASGTILITTISKSRDSSPDICRDLASIWDLSIYIHIHIRRKSILERAC